VANYDTNNVTVINGTTNATTTVAVGTNPVAVAVNPATNTIYVANYGSANVTVINGATNATTTVAVGTNPHGVAVNPVTNKIYVSNLSSNNVTVIDGTMNSTTTVAAGSNPLAIAVNPATNKIYALNDGSSNVTVIDEQLVQPVPLVAEITALPGNVTGSLTPSFNFTATSFFSPYAPNPDNLLFQVDTWQGPWTAATNLGYGDFSSQLAALQPGLQILYAYATDGQEATSTNTGYSSPLISDIAAYLFLVSPPNATLSPGSLSFGNQTVDITSPGQLVTLTNNSAGPLNITSIAASGAYSAFSNCPSALEAGANCMIDVAFTPTSTGLDDGTLTVTDDNLGVNGSTQTVSLTGTGVAQATVSPKSLTFAAQKVGTASAAKKVTLKNNLPTALTIDPITFKGADPGDFSQTNTCGASLAANSKCTISVTFTPAATGARTATMDVNDSANNSPQKVSLSGTGD